MKSDKKDVKKGRDAAAGIVKKLQANEKAVLPILLKESRFSRVVELSGLKDIEVMRAWQWLQAKGLAAMKEEVKELVLLGSNGASCRQKGLPERRMLDALREREKNASELKKELSFDDQELNIAIGTLKKKAAITIKKDNGLLLAITENGKRLQEKEFLEETFLKKTFPIDLNTLRPEEKFAFESLAGRKDIVRREKQKVFSAELTQAGKDIVEEVRKSSESYAENLTPEMIADDSWKNKRFRAYNVESPVPRISGGRRHFTHQAADHIKRIWLDMGFTEMKGSLVQTEFWDLDSLFVPQDHAARSMQDTFYIKDPEKGKIPEKLSGIIKLTHENGWDTGSKGWGGRWDAELAKKNILRTHTTVLSAQAIAKLKKEDLPAKFFSVAKVFRNEALDWKHLFEFYQVEGIVVDPDANFKHLLGYITEFYKKMGFEKVRIRPAHFPYTEPSMEVEVFHPVKKEWLELGGAGIFRPEVVKPLLGFECPVLAWGQGMERGIIEYYNINDLRELYKNDLKQMKEMRFWIE